MSDDEPRKAPSAITVGEDLTPFSRAELTERAAALEAEIARIRIEIDRKAGQQVTAESLFKS